MLGSVGWPFLHGDMTHQRGASISKQLETRRMVRQPAYVLGGAAHQAVWLADQTPMQAAAQGLDKTEDKKFRRSRFEKTHAVSIAEIPDKESR